MDNRLLKLSGHAILPDPPVTVRWVIAEPPPPAYRPGQLFINEAAAAKLREMGYGDFADACIVTRPVPVRAPADQPPAD